MDPVSIAFAIPSVIARAKAAYEFIQKFKKAGDSGAKLMTEIEGLSKTLTALHGHIDKMKTAADAPLIDLAELDRSVRACAEILGAVISKFNHGEKEVMELQQALAKHEAYFVLVLQIDTSSKVIDVREEQERIKAKEVLKEEREAYETRLKEIQEIAKWLQPTDAPTRLQELAAQRQDGTCTWVSSNDHFASWRSTPGACLWIHGIHKVLRTIIAQLVRYYRPQSSKLNETFKELLDAISRDERPPSSLTPLVELFHSTCADSGWTQVFVVIEALDECDTKQRESLLLQLAQMTEVTKYISLLVTSRPEQDITDAFLDAGFASVSLVDEDESVRADMKARIKWELANRRKLRRLEDATKIKIEETLLLKAGGMLVPLSYLSKLADEVGRFRWVDLVLDLIEKQFPFNDVENTPEELPVGLFNTYVRILDVISQNGPNCVKVARRAVLWILAAERPLCVDELAEAITIELGSRQLNESMRLTKDEILE
ncbi:hypothetical protein H0H81_008992 [Sphagnurus paluster]|uniref:Nephrocystin 3-like N-terminal domain-containing protein n=1 Tax=Sphagnurus paluster TaxID=117069 RepID=A0A9P7GJS8_9AGAR|nr:hypothetical protein H0H81_008992 [Sphagnurus paluster]